MALVERAIVSTDEIDNKTIVTGTRLVHSLCFTEPSAFEEVYVLAMMTDARILSNNKISAMRSIFSKLKTHIQRQGYDQVFKNAQTTKTHSHSGEDEDFALLTLEEKDLVEVYESMKYRVREASFIELEDPNGIVAQKTAAKKALNECREKIKLFS